MSLLEPFLEEALGQDKETSYFLGAILLWILVVPFMLLLPTLLPKKRTCKPPSRGV